MPVMMEKSPKPVTLSWKNWVEEIHTDPVIVDRIHTRDQVIFPELGLKDRIAIPYEEAEMMVRNKEGVDDSILGNRDRIFSWIAGSNPGVKWNFWETSILMTPEAAEDFYIYFNCLKPDGSTNLGPDEAG